MEDAGRVSSLASARAANLRAERGTERDVYGSSNNAFVSFQRTGARTSAEAHPFWFPCGPARDMLDTNDPVDGCSAAPTLLALADEVVE
jgi:hypothetical protein